MVSPEFTRNDQDESAGIKSLTLLVASLFLLLAAVLQNVGQLYFMAALVISVALLTRFAVFASLRGISVSRQIVDHVMEGETIVVHLTLTNDSKLPKFFLMIEDTLSPWLESDQAKFLVPALWPGKTVELEYHCTATKRGRLQIGPLQVAAADPIGVRSRSIMLAGTASALVYPRPLEVPTHEIGGGAAFGNNTSERAARTGDGIDFQGVRDYKQGDELRRIHWKSVARHQQLTVIEFQQAFSSDIAIALDLLQGTDVGEGKETSLEYGVKVAATLGQLALDRGARVTLAMQGASGFSSTTCRRDEDYLKALELLAEAEAKSEIAVNSVVERMRSLLSPGTAVVVVTADADPRLADLARVLSGSNVSLNVVLIAAPTFLPHSSPQKPPAPIQTETLGSLADQGSSNEEERRETAPPRAANPYEALAESLRRAGAGVNLVRRGDNLIDAIRRITDGAR